MLVSWNWLKEYVPLEMSIETLTDRLTMSGLNLEEFQRVGDDWVIDLEVTSNRPDCLGHLGIAREVAALFEVPQQTPAAQPVVSGGQAADRVRVTIEDSSLCPQYHARLIEGVKVGPSPAWMQARLKTVGIASVNNVVDVTNYVMLECAQPLHAFDFGKIKGGQLIVRRAKAGETLKAINQKSYTLSADMCVIADVERPVALAGVMGGLETEISNQTTTVLIEAAAFASLSIRNTARKLDLHSPSSYRFERALDSQGPEWASRRCAELILQLAGGKLVSGVVSAGSEPAKSGPVLTLRCSRFRRILGIDIPATIAAGILERLGLTVVGPVTEESLTVQVPTFRRDLTREIDLVEEVARIYGYEHLPSDVVVPLCTSKKSDRERVVDRIGETLISLGFFEAMTPAFTSAVDRTWFQPRGEMAPLAVEHSSRRQENLLRQSLIPSLLVSRRANERQGNFQARLFEIAKVYLAAEPGRNEDETEPWMVGLVGGASFWDLKGVIEQLITRLNPSAELTIAPSTISQFTPGRGAELSVNGILLGWMGELDRTCSDAADLRDVVYVAELDLRQLEQLANFVPRAQPLAEYPGMARDLNFVLDEDVPWSELEEAVRTSAGPLLVGVDFASQYRGKQLGEGKKSYVIALRFRAPDRTLTGEEIDLAQAAVIRACEQSIKAVLRS